ncbi:FAD-dependent oxidoreductase [Sphingomonas hankyongi]|uniref:FAD-dependent oxidoreductase n=1 Tax=Sphingomonas hankyongi TaxID=2908209 RepID=A0ABT0S4G4_9SPHN|nr:FAD-dependent oxidoreductase [Sphingomonas hankyongi]MCL6730513.1 FAD-dependent oxidoreductase [Sphingomonas hankyongi]
MTSDLDLIVVGGGPAGVMAGLLFARAGCKVQILEKHADFFRDFRGDTVHPSTMEILDQLGMLERFLARPHDRVDRAELRIAGREWTIGDLSHLHTAAPFIAMMPQWDFLDFLRGEAAAFPTFDLQMSAPVTAFVESGGRVTGVRLGDGSERKAKLTIAADGRSSIARNLLPLADLGAPMDVFWFRVGKKERAQGALRGNVERGRLLVMIDRGDYWQCAFLIPKGAAEAYQARGIDAIREEVAAAAPPDLDLADLDEITDLHLLTVKLDRLTQWWRPGLLAIGDAAHAMSPIGGIGINLAIQDAVAAANALAVPLRRGDDIDPLLHKVQDRRMLPTQIIQAGQKAAQDRVIGRLLQGGEPIRQAPMLIRMLNRFPMLRRIPGRIIGLGFRRERVRSPLDSVRGE